MMAEAENDKDDEDGVRVPERRDFLSRASCAAMAAGLVGGYGAFGAVAARYMYPPHEEGGTWQFLMEIGRMKVGDSLRYRAPAGEMINVTRRAANGDVADFVALSSTCPHLGCQVHWQSQENRFFCPCHNGTFDLAGLATSGPPADAQQSLPRYPLGVVGGLVYIKVQMTRLIAADASGEILDEEDCVSGPGHDPCLDKRPPSGGRA